ncbi:3-hydroxy-2-methylbutyryl-CoA dehydrogenase [Streptomyces humidus]|uniref:3-hydroxy-2-methylbutyryl-CoA dehydrogenase n=1 Tax=Streptomyces humidus TaxID=52259 RepID=A0A918G5U2_9ACTN|nr:SDR family oxidoreductase [Streptomyces humidus]GGS20741.1 3-hydroxy-2-methylbutyryl-CoA dehydrogenase [Streptomyces humidus]
MDLQNTAAIVTGGASGLGAATAQALAGQGAAVFAFDLQPSMEKARAVDGVTYVAVDVTDVEGVRLAVATAVAAGRPLRTVVNCAGIGTAGRVLNKDGSATDPALFARTVSINLVGSYNVLALAAEQIAKTGPLGDGARGIVINTASVAAFEGQIGQEAYAASKGGIVGLNLPAARDLAQYGIRVNTIAPGIVETPMLAGVTEEFQKTLAAGVPFPRRLARPEEYARLAVFLIEHDYINGEVIRMDGALRMAPR